MANTSFFQDMRSRNYRPLPFGDCTECDALSECFEIHMTRSKGESCPAYFMSLHGVIDGHWVKEEV